MYSGESPVRIVLDPKSELPEHLNLFVDRGSSLIITEEIDKQRSPDKEFISVPKSESHISDILEQVYQRGIFRILVEGGAKTIQKFIDSNNWDEARIITSIKPLFGGIKAPYISGKITESFKIQHDTISIMLRID